MPDSAEAVAARWMQSFDDVIHGSQRIDEVLTDDASWRDIVALTWDIRSAHGREPLQDLAQHAADQAIPGSWRLSDRHAPELVTRGGREVVEAFLEFETRVGRGEGVVRLVPGGETARARTLMTALRTLNDRPERAGDNRPNDVDLGARFGKPNWRDQRAWEVAYEDREPTVLVVGSGQAGLSVAARLRALGVDVLVIEQHHRVGDNWRNRYYSLTLHNDLRANQLPYLPFPETWPLFVPKDQFAGWLEYYAEAMELNVWTDTAFSGADWDEDAGHWNATVTSSSGFSRELHPRHLVVCTGVSNAPRLPSMPGLESFRGRVLHSSEFTDAKDFHGHRAVVFGVGNSGSDIAQALSTEGNDVTMVQRGSVTVVSHKEGSLLLQGEIYARGLPLEVADLVSVSNPYPAYWEAQRAVTEGLKELDHELIASLNKVGFKTDYGEDETGFGMKYLRYGGGHYLNIGCSELIADGTIGLLQYEQIARVVPQGIELTSGEVVEASLLVFGTGFRTLEQSVTDYFGPATAAKVGRVWGLDAEGELANMWRPTPQQGLWFHAGSLYQCRIFSKYLALQIAADELGLRASRPRRGR